MEMMEVSAGKSPSDCKQPSEHTKSANHRGKKTAEKEMKTSVSINYGATAWHENRKKWVGDKSQHTKRNEKDPIISWTTSYDDLLSSNAPFSEPIPLPEMVDFLVDIWQDEGLFDFFD
ncbi:hypothetical protein L484_017045 [Morus notabilis]|uniref:Gag1-like clamp domain-containing protein n=1 Tax=Morus notabilis TaxID=981085 RepID=W9RLG0_9ROSA|nr:uncharacterized protein LOC21400067 [Morus notabilis]XP_024025974.1 uncharacterized protein LOC21400067 [Morus notabilis]EXB96196.1 hypothetical protein L484_017045 [Morus notabilis]